MPVPFDNSIYIFIGQKGSGKSFTGKIVQDLYGIYFIRVEDIAKQIKKGRSIDDDSYHKEVFNQIESYLRKVLKSNSHIIFESNGLTSHFDLMLENLERD